MKYRLALDLGSTSLGWAMVRLNQEDEPCAIIKAGVRIFSDGRNPKDGSSLAVTRRTARAMRRRRDRLLKRKATMMRRLIEHGFFPQDEASRKALERLNPYELRAKGLDRALTGQEFARALFHINQRRGFKSNRKTDKKDDDSGAMKQAMLGVRGQLSPTGEVGKARTVGEWLWRRMQQNVTVRARYRKSHSTKADGKTKVDKSYDLYIDRAMIEQEFDALWDAQSLRNPALFNEAARASLKDALLFQRPLKPVRPGRCTLMPEEQRAPLALPSTQRFRIYQEVHNLRILREGLVEVPLTLEQRDQVVDALEKNSKRSFTQIKKLLKLGGSATFNLEDAKREELKGNTTSAILSKPGHFGDAWFAFSEAQQDEIVQMLVAEESEQVLVEWLKSKLGISEKLAEVLANVGLPEGYGSLSAKALAKILPVLRTGVLTYDKAVVAAGFEHHSHISHAATGEILPALPYYGEYLQRHVGFGSGDPAHTPEKRYGKIANPTVHIGLNQVRKVVNCLIERYGHPSEVIVEVARELKQSQDERKRTTEDQAKNQKRNERLRKVVAENRPIAPERVKQADIQKLILWEELSYNVAERCCPYSGVQLSAQMVLSDQVEVEHILPFSRTLDDSLNNKTVAMRAANRVKGNRTPAEARQDFEAQGWSYDSILLRAERMNQRKRYRFGVDGYEKWLKDDKGFLARALNDTRYLSRVAREYLSLICPQGTRVIPGQMTAMLRAKFGLNDILGLEGEKNRNDHRHHAVDACVIAVTDQRLLQRFAQASASARENQLNRLVERMPMPWPTYREHAERAVRNIYVSHKPDHGYEDEIFDKTIYSPAGFSRMAAKTRAVIPFFARAGSSGIYRHVDSLGNAKPYKGLLSNSNYCAEIVRTKNAWTTEVLPTYKAYEFARSYRKQNPNCEPYEILSGLRASITSLSGKPLVMRLSIDDTVRAEIDGTVETLQVLKINSSGAITFVKINEANIPNRYKAKLDAQKLQAAGKEFDADVLNDDFFQKSMSASSLLESKARRVTISPIGELRDPGFKG
jgi:CRISPR-associated endonuclease Csn1